MFNEVLNEKKRFVNIAVRFATQLFCEFKASNAANYDLSINYQFNFINEILSLPTITKYWIPMLESQQTPMVVDYKLLYQSFYFSKQSSLDEEETKQDEQ